MSEADSLVDESSWVCDEAGEEEEGRPESAASKSGKGLPPVAGESVGGGSNEGGGTSLIRFPLSKGDSSDDISLPADALRVY